jgi:hypothetical protein
VRYLRSFFLLWAKVSPNKTGISFGSFILELKRISGGEFEIYLESGWFSALIARRS